MTERTETMSRKDYIALASALSYFQSTTKVSEKAYNELTQAIADVCVDDNPRFDRRRFYTACGRDDRR